MKLDFRIADSKTDIERCQNVISEIYCHEYGAQFSNEETDLNAKIEKWPHQYLMLWIDQQLAGVCGLYLFDTYVERYGNVQSTEISDAFFRAGYRGQTIVRRELSKLVVLPEWRGQNLASILWAAGCSRNYLGINSDEMPMLLFCAKTSIVDNIMRRYTNVHLIKEFPVYRVHEKYRSKNDPMYSYLTIPDIDVPIQFRQLCIPGTYDIRDLECCSRYSYLFRPKNKIASA